MFPWSAPALTPRNPSIDAGCRCRVSPAVVIARSGNGASCSSSSTNGTCSRSGVDAVGFGVGSEPLVAALAARGVSVLATDQPAIQAGAWGHTGQHAAAIDDLRRPDLCPPEVFEALVAFRAVDVRSIPADLVDFDVAWSSCCFEHLGSPDLGFDFEVDSMATLRPGGVAVHTTEIDCGRRGDLLETGTVPGGDYVCFYRVGDLQRLVRRLRRSGYQLSCNFHISATHPLEQAVDEPPYSHDPTFVSVSPTGWSARSAWSSPSLQFADDTPGRRGDETASVRRGRGRRRACSTRARRT